MPKTVGSWRQAFDSISNRRRNCLADLMILRCGSPALRKAALVREEMLKRRMISANGFSEVSSLRSNTRSSRPFSRNVVNDDSRRNASSPSVSGPIWVVRDAPKYSAYAVSTDCATYKQGKACPRALSSVSPILKRPPIPLMLPAGDRGLRDQRQSVTRDQPFTTIETPGLARSASHSASYFAARSNSSSK
jgi:hypothetical protein